MSTSHTTKNYITNDFDRARKLRVDHDRNLRVGFPFGMKSLSVTSPGVAYTNGANALCLVSPTELDQIRIATFHISSKVAGDFYLVVDNLNLSPGETTNHVFDLSGIRGDNITSTSDVVLAAFLSNQMGVVAAGGFHFDCGAGNELYLLAPNVDYNIMLTWIEEIAEA